MAKEQATKASSLLPRTKDDIEAPARREELEMKGKARKLWASTWVSGALFSSVF
jgi:hypothetical protein